MNENLTKYPLGKYECCTKFKEQNYTTQYRSYHITEGTPVLGCPCFVSFVTGYVCEQLALLAKEEAKRGRVGAVYQLLPPPLGQQNQDRRRFDPLGNGDTPTNETCISRLDGPQHISKYDWIFRISEIFWREFTSPTSSHRENGGAFNVKPSFEESFFRKLPVLCLRLVYFHQESENQGKTAKTENKRNSVSWASCQTCPRAVNFSSSFLIC